MSEFRWQLDGADEARVLSEAPERTRALAFALAGLLRGGEVLCFTGDLGAGKTLFVQGVAEALGVTAKVTSPTFALLNLYQGRKLALFHFDLYRLEAEEELEEVGFYEYTEPEGGVTFIEWSERFPEAMPEERLDIAIERGAAEDERVITLRAHGAAAEKILQELVKI